MVAYEDNNKIKHRYQANNYQEKLPLLICEIKFWYQIQITDIEYQSVRDGNVVKMPQLPRFSKPKCT
jgi:hypothetical protein